MGYIRQFFINLFGPIWLRKNRNYEQFFKLKQLAAIKVLSDPAELKRAALEAPEWYVRLAAVGKIADPEVLSIVALTDTNEDVLKATVDKLDDSELIRIFEPLIAQLGQASLFEERINICDRLKNVYYENQRSDLKSKIKELKFRTHTDYQSHSDDWSGGSYGPPPYHEDSGYCHTDDYSAPTNLIRP